MKKNEKEYTPELREKIECLTILKPVRVKAANEKSVTLRKPGDEVMIGGNDKVQLLITDCAKLK